VVYGHEVPQISRFFGIAIYLHYRDHSPPHFHVRYAESSATIAIDTMEIIDGTLPARVYGLVAEWALQHHTALRENWERAMRRAPLTQIAPLE